MKTKKPVHIGGGVYDTKVVSTAKIIADQAKRIGGLEQCLRHVMSCSGTPSDCEYCRAAKRLLEAA